MIVKKASYSRIFHFIVYGVPAICGLSVLTMIFEFVSYSTFLHNIPEVCDIDTWSFVSIYIIIVTILLIDTPELWTSAI